MTLMDFLNIAGNGSHFDVLGVDPYDIWAVRKENGRCTTSFTGDLEKIKNREIDSVKADKKNNFIVFLKK